MIQIDKIRAFLDAIEPVKERLDNVAHFTIHESGGIYLMPKVPWRSESSVYLATIRQIRMIFGGTWRRTGSTYNTTWKRVDKFGLVEIQIDVPTDYLIPKKPLAIEQTVTMAADDEDDVS